MYSSACRGVAGGLALPLMALCIGEGQQQTVGLTELDMAAAKQLFLLRGDIVKEEEDSDGRERKRAGSFEQDKGRKAREGGFRGRKRFRSIDYIYKKTQPLNVRHLIKRLKQAIGKFSRHLRKFISNKDIIAAFLGFCSSLVFSMFTMQHYS